MLIIIPIVIVIEGTCFFLLGSPERMMKDFALPELPDGHIAKDIGYVPYGDSVIADRKEVDGKLVFDVHYSIDEHIRRITPEYDSTRNQYALFFGCSVAFGYGIEDHETMAYFYQDNAGVNSYNYAYSGWATNNMLARLQRDDLSKNVIEKDGVGFYIFFWDHIHRAIGTMDRYTEWVHPFPYYYMDDGEIKRNKSFKDGRYWVSKFYEFVYNSSIVEYFKINIPNKIRSHHLDLVSEMILESKKNYQKQFGNDQFYTIILPHYQDVDHNDIARFLEYLDAKGIQYIDLSTFVEYGPEYHLEGDSHPNSRFNKMISEEIYKRLQNLKK